MYRITLLHCKEVLFIKKNPVLKPDLYKMYSLNKYHGGQSVIVVKLILGEFKCVKAFILKKFDRNPATQKASSNSS